MNIILLSGGSGKRLWPLSNEFHSKQFIKIFKTDAGYQSMLQRVLGQIRKADPGADITIATSKSQVSVIKGQIGETDISIEPCRRDTFPAIALATAYLHDIKGINENEAAVVCPVDPYVNDGYFEVLKQMTDEVLKGNANITLIGITPTYPSEKYGYIIPETTGGISKVKCFKEKPTEDIAKEYIADGALWNGGVFAYRIKYVLDIAKKNFGTSSYYDLLNNYEKLEKISFDYAVVEKECSINVVRYSGTWMDLGTWNTLTDVLEDVTIGNALADEYCDDVNIINQLDIPVLAMGIRDAVVVASPDGILVADKKRSQKIKDYVDRIAVRPMYEEKAWGMYKVLDNKQTGNGEEALTQHLTVIAGKKISYQRHRYRKEVWTIVSGKGQLLLDGDITEVSAGDVITIEPNMLHSIKAADELHIIEVQLGNSLAEEDTETVPYEW